MISRRTFVSTSVVASAEAILGRRRDSPDESTVAAAPRADAELRVFFVGGTALVNEQTHYTALQLSGAGLAEEFKHASFIVAPKGTLHDPSPLGDNDLHPDLANHGNFEMACLTGKDIIVASTDGDLIDYKCKKVAHFKHIAAGWKRKEPWTPGQSKPVNSRFTLIGGVLDDGTAVNKKGSKVEWWVKHQNMKKYLSDVVLYKVDAGIVTVSGLNPSKILLTNGKKLALYVFSGPLHDHKEKYKVLRHAQLLTTIYDVGATEITDILPTTADYVDPEDHKKVSNPCVVQLVPPDSEFCVNYDELP